MTERVIEANLLSVDDLVKLGDARFEIIHEELIEMAAVGVTHQLIARNVQRVIDPYISSRNLGEVFADGFTYLMFSDARGLKASFIPDVSFIRAENILKLVDPTRPYPGIPDLAVEVVSPGDDADQLMLKVRTYLEKGTEQVWILYQTVREVHQYRLDQNPPVRIYRGAESLDLETLFPGLLLTPEMIFELPAWANVKSE
ncbi:MAG: Uma2 family endonuclease [Anaerolineae bacterium]|nr:Uma2 family endonuclease [Anaerolineae bacterium]